MTFASGVKLKESLHLGSAETEAADVNIFSSDEDNDTAEEYDDMILIEDVLAWELE